MSESPDSSDSSLPEHDREEGENKISTVVDKFVDSFKAKASLSSAKERKRAYSAVRRGGTPVSPPVIELKAEDIELPRPFKRYSEDELEKFVDGKDIQNKHVFNLLYDPQENRNEGDKREDLGGCIRRPPRNRETNKKDGRKREDKPCFVLERAREGERERERDAREEGRRRPDSPTEEVNGAASCHTMHRPDENHPDKGKCITWTMLDPEVLPEHDIYAWLRRQEEDMKLIRSVWNVCMEQEEKYVELKAQQIERSKQFFVAIIGIDTLIDVMKDSLTFDPDYANHYSGLNYVVRLNQLMRDDFLRDKQRLDDSVKNKTATEQEVRDYIMADEMIDTLDSCIESLNSVIISGKPAEQILIKTGMYANVMDKLGRLTSLEMKNLIFNYFIKIMDLRLECMWMQPLLEAHQQGLEWANSRITSMTETIHNMREERAQLLAKYSGANSDDDEEEEGAVGGVSLPSSLPSHPH